MSKVIQSCSIGKVQESAIRTARQGGGGRCVVWIKCFLDSIRLKKVVRHFLHSEFSEEEQCMVIGVHVSLSREGAQVIIPLSTHLAMILVDSPHLRLHRHINTNICSSVC